MPPACPDCDGPMRPSHGAYMCAGRCAESGMVPVVSGREVAAPPAKPESASPEDALFDTVPAPEDPDTEGRRPNGRRR